jgi:hypothetical protein
MNKKASHKPPTNLIIAKIHWRYRIRSIFSIANSLPDIKTCPKRYTRRLLLLRPESGKQVSELILSTIDFQSFLLSITYASRLD